MAFFETTNIGALFFFHLAGIKNVFGINNSRLLAYQFKYAGKDFPKNVPGEYFCEQIQSLLMHGNKKISTQTWNHSMRVLMNLSSFIMRWLIKLDLPFLNLNF
uniref:Transposase n=1 Tax=Meloidogyne hapla TaxID=6305 RepID=A0A1I8C061_MELHA